MRGVFPGTEVQVGRRLREALEFRHASVEKSGIARTSSIVSMVRSKAGRGSRPQIKDYTFILAEQKKACAN
jgi:hypothetical protein